MTFQLLIVAGAQIFGEHTAANAELNVRVQKGFSIQYFTFTINYNIKIKV